MTDKRRAFLMFSRNLLGTFAWVILGAVAAYLIPSLPWLRQYPTIELAVTYAGATLVSLGALWGFWNSTWAYDFYARGYRVRWLAGREFVYEEFGEDEMLRSLGIGYMRLSDGYAPPCRISVPTEDNWLQATPVWAHDRRAEIVERLVQWAQRGHDPMVTVVAPERLEAA